MTPYHDDGQVAFYQGDVREVLPQLEAESIQCVVTSPPYWGLRDYGTDGQLGLEPTPEAYVQNMVAIFREIRRVLRKDGTVWLNLGDSYAGSWGNYAPGGIKGTQRPQSENGKRWERPAYSDTTLRPPTSSPPGLKPKDLVGIPWRVAFALQADGWWLRSDIVWSKPNPMPESVQDRPTRAHEYIFLLTKSERYYYDAVAVAEPPMASSIARISQNTFAQQQGGDKDYANGVNPNRSARRTLENWAGKFHGGIPRPSDTKGGNQGQRPDKQRGHSRPHTGFNDHWDAMTKAEQQALGRNKRSVWTVATQPYPEAHFATFPEDLIKPCILAGTSERGCCSECGAPWARVVEKGFTDHDGETGSAYDEQSTAGRLAKLRQASRQRGGEYVNGTQTTGWQPSCSHEAPADPCVVLDPFLGSGTTAKVAKDLGRRCIGIDLKADYLDLAVERNRQLGMAFV